MSARTRFAWKPAYETGEDHIDTQHKKLMELANLLWRALEAGMADAVVDDALDALAQYAGFHFEDEEAYFRAHGCPTLDAHRREHERMKAEVADMVEDRELGFTATSSRLLEWVETRLVPHIIYDDRYAIEQIRKAKRAGD